MKQTRYWGELKSNDGNIYRVEIQQESAYPFLQKEIKFSGDGIEIEYSDVEKWEPVQASSATLNIWSDTDRQFADLYTVAEGEVIVWIERNGKLWWTGNIDTELYEEEYASASDYPVSITFNDFGALQRKNWDRKGFATVRQILTHIIGSAGIFYRGIVEKVSTKITQGAATSIITDCSVNQDNYYDEDGQPMTLYDVLEYTLQAFSLRIVQRGGWIYIYDMQALSNEPTEEVYWTDTDAYYSVDKTYNNVQINLSTMEKIKLIDEELDEKDVGGNVISGKFMIPEDSGALSFQLRIGTTLPPEKVVMSSAARSFNLIPNLSGDDCTGIAYVVDKFNYGTDKFERLINGAVTWSNAELFRMAERTYISGSGDAAENRKLCVEMPILVSSRRNPFEEASIKNEQGNSGEMDSRCIYGLIPFKLLLKDDSGNVIAHYENRNMSNNGIGKATGWVYGDCDFWKSYLLYYNTDRKKSAFGGGWVTNRQAIGKYKGSLPISMQRRSGELIDMPMINGQYLSGWLEIYIGEGIQFGNSDREQQYYQEGRYKDIHWLMYKLPTVKVVNEYGQDVEAEDVEIKAWINKSAKEDLKIDTFVGCNNIISPCSLAQVVRTSDRSSLSTFYRGKFSGTLEKLLIGSIYSNYADRNIKLSGTVRLMPDMKVLTEKNQAGKFVMASTVQYLHLDEEEITMVTFNEDNYECIEYK